MGQARIFKRLRKEAGYSWLAQGKRHYEKVGKGGSTMVLRNYSRAIYRNLKKALLR